MRSFPFFMLISGHRSVVFRPTMFRLGSCAARPRALLIPGLRASRPRLHTLTRGQPRIARAPLLSAKEAIRHASRRLASSAEAASEAGLPWYQTEKGRTILGNFSYVLQLGGFLMIDPLLMRSFLVGGSSSFVLYALVQPQKLWVPALWEGTFASIHAYMIYGILNTQKVALTKDELRLYGMVFQHHDLEVEEFQSLLEIGSFKTLPPGQDLTTAGTPVENVYVIVRGDVTAHAKGGDVPLSPGKYVGEVSLLKVYADAKKGGDAKAAAAPLASATCTCQSETHVFVWNQDALLKFLKHDERSAKVLKSIFADVLTKYH